MAFKATNAFELALLKQIFNSVAFSFPSTLYFSLHTADPGEAGNQSTSEIVYPTYARVAVACNTDNWLCNTVSDISRATSQIKIEFPMCLMLMGGPLTVTHVGIGTAATGAGMLMFYLPVGSVAIDNDYTPRIVEGSYVECD